jgi:Flp pilus assembly pilin Flp
VLYHQRLEKGQALTEYAFILVLVVVVCIAIAATLGPIVRDMYQAVIDLFP